MLVEGSVAGVYGTGWGTSEVDVGSDGVRAVVEV